MSNIEVKKEANQTMEKAEAQTPGQMERTHERMVFIPRTDIYETADGLVLVADMPGVDENSVDINVERRVLTITGQMNTKESVLGRAMYTEYETGDYERSFTLAEEVDAEHIAATVKNGVLRLILPKSEKAKPKKIAVKAG